MKYSTSLIAASLALSSGVAAFPRAMYSEIAGASADTAKHLKLAIRDFEESKKEKRAPGFNAAEQYVSNQGDHKFVAPTNVNTLRGDQRGPCPGLNAMANHNYIPHNGIASIQQFIDGTYTVFGMGKDLGGFLAIYGALIDGNGLAWSIGGASSQLPSINLLSQPQGISGSHNKYESDVSPTRPDLFEYGNTYKFILSQWEELYGMQTDPATANYNLDILTAFRASRFSQSVANNPYFFNGPFSGVLVQPAAYTFIYRFMGNKSAEFPEGRLDQKTLKTFFSVTGEPGSFVWREGYEAIPDNWYKRAVGDSYTIPFFIADLTDAALKHPEFINIGGNTGKPNTFTGVDITNVTGGVFNSATLLEGNNLACFVFQTLQQGAPDLIKGLIDSDGSLLGRLTGSIDAILGPYACPELKNIDSSQYENFPGYTRVN